MVDLKTVERIFIISISMLFLGIQINAQKILINPDTLFVGDIPVGSESVRKIVVYNTDSQTMNISNIGLENNGAGEITIPNNPGTATLSQLQKIELEIKYSPSSSDSIKAHLVITSNASTSPDKALLFGKGSTETPIAFERVFGSEENDGLSSVLQTPDGGYICAGSTIPDGDDFNNILIIKTDENGLLQWWKDYGDDETENANTVLPAENGNYAVFSRTDSEGEGGFDFYMMEVDATGEVVWDQTYGGNKDEQANSMVQVEDGYILAGNTRSFGDELSTDIYVIKISKNGSVIWEKTYGGTGGEGTNKIIKTQDGNFVIIGSTASFGGGFDAYILKINGSGNVVWEKNWGGNESDEGSDIVELEDGNLAVLGYTVSYGAGGRDIFLLKLNPSGDEIWFNTYGDDFQDIPSKLVAAGNNIIFVGTISETLDIRRRHIFAIDPDGNTLIHSESVKGRVSGSAGDIIINKDGNLVIVGSSSSGSSNGEVYILNTSAFSEITSVESERTVIEKFHLYQNYPNPFNNQTQISFYLEKSGPIELNVYDVLGQKVESLINGSKSAGLHKVKYNADNLISGVYFLRLKSGTNFNVRRMLFLK